MCIRQIKIREELGIILSPAIYVPFVLLTGHSGSSSSFPLHFSPFPPSKFHPLEQPSAALLPHGNLQFKIKNEHTHTRQRQNPGPFVALVMPVARGQSDLTLQGILWPEENCFSQTCHCIATKSFKYFPREFPSESQVHQAWGTSASGETV